MLLSSRFYASSTTFQPVLLQGLNPCSPVSGGAFAINALVPWYCSYINQAVYNNWVSWLPLALLVVTLSFTIAGVIFMAGIMLRNEKVRSYGVAELYEAGATAILVIFFMLVAAVLLGIFPSIIGGNGIAALDPFQASLNYISNTITVTNGFLSSLFNSVLLPYLYSSIQTQVCWPECQDFGAPGGALIIIAFVLPAEAFAKLIVDGLLLLNAEYYLIIFGMTASIPVFLLPGIIMRAIIPLRSVGGMFMAIAIGFYFIMPTLFGIAFSLTHSNLLTTMLGATQQINNYGQGAGAETYILNGKLPSELKIAEGGMGTYWMSVLFYPALILALTYAAVITIADFIGGFSSYSSKTLLSRT